MMYNKEVIDNLVSVLVNSIAVQESNQVNTNSLYDLGVLDGSHDTMIDVLNLLGVPHNFTHIN